MGLPFMNISELLRLHYIMQHTLSSIVFEQISSSCRDAWYEARGSLEHTPFYKAHTKGVVLLKGVPLRIF